MKQPTTRPPSGDARPVFQAPPSKTRITIRIDDDVLQWFRHRVKAGGGGNYQTLINVALREYMESRERPIETTIRSVIRQELSRHEKRKKS